MKRPNYSNLVFAIFIVINISICCQNIYAYQGDIESTLDFRPETLRYPHAKFPLKIALLKFEDSRNIINCEIFGIPFSIAITKALFKQLFASNLFQNIQTVPFSLCDTFSGCVIDKEIASKIGNILNVDAILTGRVIETHFNIPKISWSAIGWPKNTANLTVGFYIIKASTGEVIFSDNIISKAESGGVRWRENLPYSQLATTLLKNAAKEIQLSLEGKFEVKTVTYYESIAMPIITLRGSIYENKNFLKAVDEEFNWGVLKSIVYPTIPFLAMWPLVHWAGYGTPTTINWGYVGLWGGFIGGGITYNYIIAENRKKTFFDKNWEKWK